MAVTKIHRQHVPNDFENNELLNVVLQHLIEEPVINTSGKIYYNSFKKIPFYSDGTEWIPFFGKPVQFRYPDEASMLSEQPIHNNGYLYYREDEDVYYEYLGTTNGNMSDYNPIGGSGVYNNEVMVIYVDPNSLSGVGTLKEQVVEYINNNITIDYSRQYSKIDIVLGIDPNPSSPVITNILYGGLYNGYVKDDPRKITSSDDWVIPDRDVNDNGWGKLFNKDLLTNFSGPPDRRGDITNIKDTTPGIWSNLNVAHNNSRGLTIRPGGVRYNDGTFAEIGTAFYGGSNNNWDSAICVQGSEDFALVIGGFGPTLGLSIRLVNNNTLLNPGEEGVYIGNDGKVYRTICISTNTGNQEWLTQNLAETKFRNNDDIPFAETNLEWQSASPFSNGTPAMCWYNNDISNALVI